MSTIWSIFFREDASIDLTVQLTKKILWDAENPIVKKIYKIYSLESFIPVLINKAG